MTTATDTRTAINRAIIAALYAADEDRRSIAASCDPRPLTIRLWPDGDITRCNDRSVPESQYYSRKPYPIDVYYRGEVHDSPDPEISGLMWDDAKEGDEDAFEFQGQWYVQVQRWDMCFSAEESYREILEREYKSAIETANDAFNIADFEFRELTGDEETFAETWID